MDTSERQLVLEELASSEARLLELVDGLSPAQWSFRETAERWSIAENIEHLAVFEGFVLQMIVTAMEGSADPERRGAVSGKDGLVMGLPDSRSGKFIAREAARPTGRWPDSVRLVEEFRRARARTMTFAAETDAELRDYFFPHVIWGDLDCFQWLLLLGRHGLRHAAQIEEIQADLGYPAG